MWKWLLITQYVKTLTRQNASHCRINATNRSFSAGPNRNVRSTTRETQW